MREPAESDGAAGGGESPEDHAQDVFKALSHPIRLAILRALEPGPRTYGALLQRVGRMATTPSSSKGKFNYHLDVLKRVGLLEQEDDAYTLTSLGVRALAIAVLADPDVAARRAREHARDARADIAIRATRGTLAGTAAGAFAIAFATLADAASRAPGSSVPEFRVFAAWGLVALVPAFLLAALTPVPAPALMSTRLSRGLRLVSCALLAGIVTASPILVYRALLQQQGFVLHLAENALVLMGATLLWGFALGALRIPARRRARPAHAATPDATQQGTMMEEGR